MPNYILILFLISCFCCGIALPQSRNKIEPSKEKYRFMTTKGEIFKISDATIYRNKVNYVNVYGDLNYLYANTELFGIRHADTFLPVINLGIRGHGKIEVILPSTTKERSYRLAKDWLKDIDSLIYPKKLWKEYGIEYQSLNPNEDALDLSVLIDKKNKRLKWKGFYKYFFCYPTKQCYGAHYIIDLKFNKKGYTMNYSAFVLNSQGYKKHYFIDDFVEGDRFFDFGKRNYEFHVNSISTSIYKALSKENQYSELRTLYNKKVLKKRMDKRLRKKIKRRLKEEEKKY